MGDAGRFFEKKLRKKLPEKRVRATVMHSHDEQ